MSVLKLTKLSASWLKKLAEEEVLRYETAKKSLSVAAQIELKVHMEQGIDQYICFMRHLRDVGLENYALVDMKHNEVVKKEVLQ
jgi:hypothetical protein